MNIVSQFLIEHGVMLAAGATILLAAGSVITLLLRAPIKRQRAGELTIAAVLLWLCLACIPLPRWSLFDAEQPASEPILVQEPIAVEPDDASLTPAKFDAADETARIAQTQEILRKLAELDAETLPATDIVAETAEPVAIENSMAMPPTPISTDSTNTADVVETDTASVGLALPAMIAVLYVAVGTGCLAWLLLGTLLLARVTSRAEPPPAWLAQLYDSLSADKLPRLLVTSACRRAFSCGWWRPTIVLPADCCREDRREQLRQILLHELAHLRHGDQRGRVLFNVALPLLYVHPLYWWIRGRTYLAAELLADDWAAGHSSTAVYAGELIALVKEQGRRGLAHVGTVGIFSSPTQFYRRMEMLVRRKTPLMNRCSRRWRMLTLFSAVACVVLLSGLLGVGFVQAEAEGDEKQQDAKSENAEVSSEPEGQSGDEISVKKPAVEAEESTPGNVTPVQQKPEIQDDSTSAISPPAKAKSPDGEGPKSGRLDKSRNRRRASGTGGVSANGKRRKARAGLLGRDRDDDEGDRGLIGRSTAPAGLRSRGGFSRRGDDDDDFRPAAGGRRRGGRGFGRGRDDEDELIPADQLMAELKSLHRDVLILRLKFINRRPTEKERKIRDLLDAAEGKSKVKMPKFQDTQNGILNLGVRLNDEQIISRIYDDILQVKQNPSQEELEIVRQIFKLSDNRLESIFQLLESKGQVDDATRVAVMARELEQKFAKLERELPDLAKRIESPAADGEDQEDRMSGFINKYRELNRARSRLKLEVNELSKLDKKLGSIGGPYDSPTPVYRATKVQPPIGLQQAPATVKKVRTVVRERRLPDGKVVREEIHVPELPPPTVPSKPKKTPQPKIFDDSSTPASREREGGRKKSRKSNRSSELVPSPVPHFEPFPDLNEESLRPEPPLPEESDGAWVELPDSPRAYVPRNQSSQSKPALSPTPPIRIPKPATATPALASTDPVSLAVNYSTTLSKLKQAEANFDFKKRQAKKGYLSAAELNKSRYEVELQTRLLATLKTVSEVLQQTTKAELDALKFELEQAIKKEDQVSIAQLQAKRARIEGNLLILKTIK